MNSRRARKIPITPDRCRQTGCKRAATYRVFGGHGTYFGDYCDEHVEPKMLSLDEYDAAMQRAIDRAS